MTTTQQSKKSTSASSAAQSAATTPLVLTITLHPDGTGTVLTSRDQLASLMAFQYQSIDDVMQALQNAANHLITIEQNPPADVPVPMSVPTPAATRPSATSPSSPSNPKLAATSNAAEPESDANDVNQLSLTETEAIAEPAHSAVTVTTTPVTPLASVKGGFPAASATGSANPSDQLQLF